MRIPIYTEGEEIMYITWNKIITDMNKDNNDEATPESLRSAAKILEEKAKELEKPKLTAKQKAILAYADEKDIGVIVAKGGKIRDVRGNDYGDKAGQLFEWESWEEAESLMDEYQTYYHDGQWHSVRVGVIKEKKDWCDWRVVVKYPYEA